MKEYINKNLDLEIDNFSKLKNLTPVIENISRVCIQALKSGNKILFCGNGGSAGDSQHLAAELIGRYKNDRKSLAAIALTTDTSNITAIGNDFGFENIFSRQIEGLGKAGDILIGISTSGNSKNIINAINVAKKIGLTTIAFTGFSGGKLKDTVDYLVNVPSSTSNNIQEMHIALGHIICGLIEKEVCNE